MGESVAIHTNWELAHQRIYARCLRSGFQRHGLDAFITPSRHDKADIHVVLGPHYAKKHWLNHPQTILLDRAWWEDPHYVRLSWMGPGGTDTITTGHDDARYKPPLKPWNFDMTSLLYLPDYGAGRTATTDREAHTAWNSPPAAGERWHSRYVRLHPAERNPQESLERTLWRYDTVLGHATTALVVAAIEGRTVFCTEPTNPVWPVAEDARQPEWVPHWHDRRQWLCNLSYHQYNADEIKAGLAWEFLCQYRQSHRQRMSPSPTSKESAISI